MNKDEARKELKEYWFGYPHWSSLIKIEVKAVDTENGKSLAIVSQDDIVILFNELKENALFFNI